MSRSAKAMSLVMVAACVVSVVVGCQGSTKQGTTYTILPSREIQTTLSADLPTVHARALKVLRDDLAYTIESEAKDGLEGIIKARTARNDMVRVETFKEADNQTKVQVYSGFITGEDKARQVLEMIVAGIPSAQPAERPAAASATK